MSLYVYSAVGWSRAVCTCIVSGIMVMVLMFSTVPSSSHAQTPEQVVLSTLLGQAQKSASVDSSPAKTIPITTSVTSTTSPTSTTANIAPATPVPDTDSDIGLTERITAVFAEINDLKGVIVAVNQGHVTLTGDVPNESVAQQAVRMAGKFSGVTGISDNMTRTLAIQDNVTNVFGNLKERSIGFIRALPLIIIGLVMFYLISKLGRLIASRQSFWQKVTPNPFITEMVGQSIRAIFGLFGIIVGLSFIGAESLLTTVLGGAGIIGIAVGFAVKDSIENYLASIMLSLRQPFRVNDHIVINGTKEGIVMRLTSRATILMTLEGNQLRVPNAEVFKGVILNYSTNPERKFTFTLDIATGADAMQAIKVALDAIKAQDFAIDIPKSSAVISDINGSITTLKFSMWVNQTQTDYDKARSLSIYVAKNALDKHGYAVIPAITRVQMLSHEMANTVTTVDKDKQAPKDTVIKIDDELDEVLKATPNDDLAKKIAQNQRKGDKNLLDNDSPTE